MTWYPVRVRSRRGCRDFFFFFCGKIISWHHGNIGTIG